MQPKSLSLFPIKYRPYGLTYGEWSAKWWQWLLSIPRSASPAIDTTGEKTKSSQCDQNVFFLCQTVESLRGRKAQDRTISMKAGKSIFIPIINWISIMGIDGQSDEQLLIVAKDRMNVVSELQVNINGVKITESFEQYRAQSPFFEVMLPEDNIFHLTSGLRRTVADGYWLFLKPVYKDIRLTTYGSCSSGINKFGIDYQITLV